MQGETVKSAADLVRDLVPDAEVIRIDEVEITGRCIEAGHWEDPETGKRVDPEPDADGMIMRVWFGEETMHVKASVKMPAAADSVEVSFSGPRHPWVAHNENERPGG